MQTKVEAPVPEPLSLERNGVELTGVGRRFGAVVALEGLSLRVRPGEVRRRGGALRLRQVDAARARRRAAGARRGPGRWSASRDGACAYMPQRDLLLPWRDALGNAALALECQGVPKARGARARAEPLFERFGLAEFERTRPAGLSGRDAPARGLPPHAAARPAGAAARRAVRLARLDHPRLHAAVARRRAAGRAAHRAARDPRRRGGGLPGRPRGGALAPARAGWSPRSTVPLPRPALARGRRDRPEVARLKRQALEALR